MGIGYVFGCLLLNLAFPLIANAETLMGGVEVNESLPAVVPKQLEAKEDHSSNVAMPKQDCICFNDSNIELKNINGQWKIVDNDNWILDFAQRQDFAQQSLDIIRHYRLNNICFVGRPFADSKIKMMYFLADGQTPSGAYPGEDAISFDPNRVRAAEIDGRWKLVQDDMWMLDFGSNKEQAVNAEQIVKYYGFTKQCFVGRPGPPMMYWRK